MHLIFVLATLLALVRSPKAKGSCITEVDEEGLCESGGCGFFREKVKIDDRERLTILMVAAPSEEGTSKFMWV